MSQIAQSSDLQRLNREVIEGVKFRFVDYLIGKGNQGKENLVDIEQLQSQETNTPGIYGSGEELLNEILRMKKVKHYQQLRYLAEKHEGRIMKLRFVLSPFSFVFLLSGKEHFHIAMETLDTEEATYVWHFDKSRAGLPRQLKQVDENLNTIRNKGRQEFLQSAPSNFSRVLHDYSDERKGFILWRDLLEERLA